MNGKQSMDENEKKNHSHDKAEKSDMLPDMFPEQMDKVEISRDEYERLKKEAVEYKDKFVRIFAEFENARKRYEREKIEFVKYANEDLLVEFLAILDDLDRSVNAANAKHEDYTAFLKGVELVMAHIYDMLKKNDVKPMVSLGNKFDPHKHEILMQAETMDGEDGSIVEEFQKGYLLGEKVIRTAKVKVAVKPK